MTEYYIIKYLVYGICFFAVMRVRTDKSNSLWKMHGKVLAPVVGDGDFQVVDAAAVRLERVWQVRSHVQNVLEFNITFLFNIKTLTWWNTT